MCQLRRGLSRGCRRVATARNSRCSASSKAVRQKSHFGRLDHGWPWRVTVRTLPVVGYGAQWPGSAGPATAPKGIGVLPSFQRFRASPHFPKVGFSSSLTAWSSLRRSLAKRTFRGVPGAEARIPSPRNLHFVVQLATDVIMIKRPDPLLSSAAIDLPEHCWAMWTSPSTYPHLDNVKSAFAVTPQGRIANTELAPAGPSCPRRCYFPSSEGRVAPFQTSSPGSQAPRFPPRRSARFCRRGAVEVT